MAIKYKLFQIMKEGAADQGKWRARIVYQNTVDLAMLAEHMHNHNTPFSTGAIKGILSDMTRCIVELVAQGYVVDIEGFARFKPKIVSTGTEKFEDFGIGKNVKNLKMTCQAKKSYANSWLKSSNTASTLSKRELKNPIVVEMLPLNKRVLTKQP